MASKNDDRTTVQSIYKHKSKSVRNRSGHRLEIMVDGKIVVVLPGETVSVPSDFTVPNGIGLYER